MSHDGNQDARADGRAAGGSGKTAGLGAGRGVPLPVSDSKSLRGTRWLVAQISKALLQDVVSTQLGGFQEKSVDLRSLGVKRAYSSDSDDILQDFYIPALQRAREYCRLAGFFSSTSLAVAARGILGLVRNGGSMRLVASPRLTNDDLQVILKSLGAPAALLEERLLRELDRLQDDFVRDHVAALGWMVANGRLSIRLAVPVVQAGDAAAVNGVGYFPLFHQKVGVLRDAMGNVLTFSGSVNETAAGWLQNVEEFKVFRSWEPAENDYVQADVAKFDRIWGDQSTTVRVFDVPRAVEQRLVQMAPRDIECIQLERHYRAAGAGGRRQLFAHQLAATRAWLANGMRGIFAMATGTGKTFAALACLERAAAANTRLLVVIAAPYQHLMQQWRREIAAFGIRFDGLVLADASTRGWRDSLADALIDLSLGHKGLVLVLTTHATFASDDFAAIIRHHKKAFRTLLIADEVHGVGAAGRQKGLSDEYDFRLGLSATPRRWFDPAGTDAIYNYFGGEVFCFGLGEAIKTVNPATGETYLVPYKYLPRFAALSTEEMQEYCEKTSRIARLAASARREEDKQRHLEAVLFARANIVKNARRKYDVLEQVLDEMPLPIEWAIVYCSPQQIERVMAILNRRRIVAHRFTEEEGTRRVREYGAMSERDFLLKEFEERRYQALVAMKCLDEGVDVPPARTAVLMASSGNPREYIQRIGRVIRRCPGKREATIHDIIVLPPLADLPEELRKLERGIVQREAQRYEEIARCAMNNAQALSLIAEAISPWGE